MAACELSLHLYDSSSRHLNHELTPFHDVAIVVDRGLSIRPPTRCYRLLTLPPQFRIPNPLRGLNAVAACCSSVALSDE